MLATLRAARVPALVLSGKGSFYRRDEKARVARELGPDAVLVELESTGHAVWQSAPDAFLHHYRALVGRVRERDAAVAACRAAAVRRAPAPAAARPPPPPSSSAALATERPPLRYAQPHGTPPPLVPPAPPRATTLDEFLTTGA